ncbi:MAG: class I SAM-dependent RNA methyltransferase [Deltaproteobacteria bacterium]|nr:class I SAM-dependent RNA methyltransferase [Deltaproteobacteria bacterium]
MSDTAKLTIQRLGRDGDGLARRAGAVWSVPQTVPGDVVEALPAGASGRPERGVVHARLLRLLRPSADRVVPACPAAEECGGCDWLHVASAARLRAKAALVREALERPEDAPLEVLPAPTERFRRVTRLAVGRDGDGPVVGYRHARARRVVRLGGCPVLEPELDEVLAALAAAPGALGAWLAAEAGELWLLSDGARLVHLSRAPGGERTGGPGVGRAASAALAALRAAVPERLRPGSRAPSVEASDGGPALRVPPGGFVQANRALAPELARLAVEWAGLPPLHVLELYAGAGHLTVALARSAASLVAVESDPAAAAALAENLERRGARHARAICGDAARAAAEADPGRVVVADPPRAGLGPAAAVLAGRRPARLVLVSCDLRALARDTRALGAAGYVPRRAALCDLFPTTHHVEAVTLFEPG